MIFSELKISKLSKIIKLKNVLVWMFFYYIIKIHIKVFKFNLRFLISNTDHIIDVNKATNPHQHDQINIVCPHYAVGTPEEV